MIASWRTRSARENWHEMALRHLDMAVVLAKATPTLDDGAWFHAYHAYECIGNALIVAKGVRVPGEYRLLPGRDWDGIIRSTRTKSTHSARLICIEQYMRTVASGTAYKATYNKLHFWAHAQAAREQALYYDAKVSRLWPPERFSHSDVVRFIARVRRFVRLLWKEISLWP